MTTFTLVVIIYGIFEMKGFLNVNFIHNDTKLKHSVNRFLNGEVKGPTPKKSETNVQRR